jgi:hypothetical protein
VWHALVLAEGERVRGREEGREGGRKGRRERERKRGDDLEDAAAVPVRRNVEAIPRNSIIDKLVIIGVELLQTPLHHVIAVQVLDQF